MAPWAQGGTGCFRQPLFASHPTSASQTLFHLARRQIPDFHSSSSRTFATSSLRSRSSKKSSFWRTLRPALPAVLTWTIITSLAAGLLRSRRHFAQELNTVQAQISVLEEMMARVRKGDDMTDMEIRRHLEMVGLRERKLTQPEERFVPVEAGVSWKEALTGRQRDGVSQENEEEKAIAEWNQLVKEEAKAEARTLRRPDSPSFPSNQQDSPATSPQGVARRAPSSRVFM